MAQSYNVQTPESVHHTDRSFTAHKITKFHLNISFFLMIEWSYLSKKLSRHDIKIQNLYSNRPTFNFQITDIFRQWGVKEQEYYRRLGHNSFHPQLGAQLIFPPPLPTEGKTPAVNYAAYAF